MHPVRRQKLIFVLSILSVLVIILGLVLYALRQNINLFYSPSDIHAGKAPLNHPLRVGGLVVKGSIIRKEGLKVEFKLTDNAKILQVHYEGILPDLFREGQGIVAEGQWQGEDRIEANRVLAKHDENYMPPDVKATLVTS